MATGQAPTLTSEKERPSVSGMVSDSLAMGVAFALILTVVGRGIGFVRGLLFCRFMSDQQLGQWSMVWSFLMLLAPLAVLGLPGCFGRFVEHYRGRGQMRAFVMKITTVSCTVTLMVSAAILIFPESFSWLVFRETNQTGIIRWIGFTLIFVAAMNFLTSLMESLRQIRLVTLMRFILGTVFMAVSCSLMLVWNDMASAATCGYGISCIAASIPAVWFIWKYRSDFRDEGERLRNRELWKRIAPFALWMWWSNLGHNLFEASDRCMLIHWAPVNAELAQSLVGQYHSGRVLPLLLVSVAAVLGGLLMPYMSAAWEKGDRDRARVQLNWTIKLVAITFTVGGVFILLFAPYLFEHFLQGRYNDGRAVLPLTLVYCTWLGLYTVGQDYLWVVEKGKLAFAAVSVGLVLNIVLNCLMIPSMGLWGAVIATTIANAVNMILIYMFNHFTGCTTDAGVWLTAALPLLLLAPPLVSVACLLVVSLVAIRSNLIFNPNERIQLKTALATVRAKTGF